MIEHEVEHRYDRLAADLQQRRIAPSRYFTYEGTTEQAWRDAQREPARTGAQGDAGPARVRRRAKAWTWTTPRSRPRWPRSWRPYVDNPQAEQLRGLIDTPQQREQISNRLFERKLTDRLIAIAEGRADEHRAASAAPADAEVVRMP